MGASFGRVCPYTNSYFRMNSIKTFRITLSKTEGLSKTIDLK